MRDLRIISTCQGAREETALHASLQKLGFTACHFFEHNRRGLSACYNEALDHAAGTDAILVLAHSDLVIADASAVEKIVAATQWADVLGLVGSAEFTADIEQNAYRWSAWPRAALSGAVEHPYGPLTCWAVFGPTPRRCVILDGLLLAVDMLSIGAVRFDERFAFHLYDLDFCLTAHRAGLVCATVNVYVQHLSRGNYEAPAYLEAAAEFRRKWSNVRERC
jgi:GT2 family glycosyltransferase